MNTSGAIFLTGGWVIYAFDPARSWVCLVLFGAALFANIIAIGSGGRAHD